MRILVISDTHGNVKRLGKVLALHKDIENVLFLGDGTDDISRVPEAFAHTVYSVCGNCDFGDFSSPLSRILEFCGKKIFMCHGHEYRVKWGLDPLIAAAGAREADIALFGHTHLPVSEYVNGLYVINPGSLGHPRESKPSYAVIDVTEKDILPNIVYMNQ